MPDMTQCLGFPRKPVKRLSLLHCQGAEGGVEFRDESRRVWTPGGTVANVFTSNKHYDQYVPNPTPAPVGGSYLVIAGGPAELATPQDGFIACNKPHTWSAWVWRYPYSFTQCVAGIDGQAGVHAEHRFLEFSSTGVPSYYLFKASAPTSGFFACTAALPSPADSVWRHYEVSLDENWLMRMFIDGRLVQITQASDDIQPPSAAGIGRGYLLGRYHNNSNGSIVGLDEISFALGVEHYEDFVPPRQPLYYPPRILL